MNFSGFLVCYNQIMNKIDKIFKWVSIMLLFLIIVLIAIFLAYFFNPLEVFIIPLFVCFFISVFLIPTGDLILIFIFFIKLFSKNKTKKDDEKLILNLISIIFYSILSIFCIAFLFLIFMSDGINS